jgi:hypothetical protein
VGATELYDRTAGVGEIYSTDGRGNLTLLKSDRTWRKTWTSIHAIGLCELMLYDANAADVPHNPGG